MRSRLGWGVDHAWLNEAFMISLAAYRLSPCPTRGASSAGMEKPRRSSWEISLESLRRNPHWHPSPPMVSKRGGQRVVRATVTASVIFRSWCLQEYSLLSQMSKSQWIVGSQRLHSSVNDPDHTILIHSSARISANWITSPATSFTHPSPLCVCERSRMCVRVFRIRVAYWYKYWLSLTRVRLTGNTVTLRCAKFSKWKRWQWAVPVFCVHLSVQRSACGHAIRTRSHRFEARVKAWEENERQLRWTQWGRRGEKSDAVNDRCRFLHSWREAGDQQTPRNRKHAERCVEAWVRRWALTLETTGGCLQRRSEKCSAAAGSCERGEGGGQERTAHAQDQFLWFLQKAIG